MPNLDPKDLICIAHFESKFIGSEHFLMQNAWPTLRLSEDSTDEKAQKCSSCSLEFDSLNPKHPRILEDVVKKIFEKNAGFQVST